MGTKTALWMSGPSSDNTVRSKGHEERLAERLSGNRMKRSGGIPATRRDRTTSTTRKMGIKTKTQGTDIKTVDLHIEHKHTINESLAIKREWLEIVKESAHRALKDPALIITFDQSNKGKKPEDWIMIPLGVFERLRDRAAESK